MPKRKSAVASTKGQSTSEGDKGKSPKSVPSSAKKQKTSYPSNVDESTNYETKELQFTKEIPTKNKNGELLFNDWQEFRPNMTPMEVLQAGSFGGTYFRPIKSSITGKSYSGVWKELPSEWLKGLNIGKQVSSSTYHEDVNTYGVKCGGSLEMWEESGWIHKQDPYGWFQWYCRFYQGRRSHDDARQVGRWLRCAGPTGRWRNNLIAKCVRSGCAYDNMAVSPVVRQTLQHWAYKLTLENFKAYAKKVKR